MPFTKETAREAGAKSSRIGTPNKTTAEVRESFKLLVENKLPELEKWIDEVAKQNPAKALDLIIRMSEYVVPKLNRTEFGGDSDFKPVIIKLETIDNAS